MDRWTPLISALAVKSLRHLFAIVWVSVIVLLGLFVRPVIITAVGPRYWMLTVLPLYILLFMIWISFVVLVLRNPGLFVDATPSRRTRRPAESTRGTG